MLLRPNVSSQITNAVASHTTMSGIFFPKSALLQPPDADQPCHRHAKPQIGAEIREANSCWMSQRNSQTPRQSLCKSKPHVPPRTHVAHHSHPTEPLAEERAGRIIVRYGLHRVRKQFRLSNLVARSNGQPEDHRRACFQIASYRQMQQGARGLYNGRSEGELNSIQLLSDQNSRIEVGIHADGLQMLHERFIVDGYVEAGHATHFRVAQRSDYRAQVIWLDADVTVADDQKLVFPPRSPSAPTWPPCR